jgi:hypothetical protein
MVSLSDIYGSNGATVTPLQRPLTSLYGYNGNGGSSTSAGAAAQPQKPLVNYGAANPVGFGYGYSQPQNAYGFPQGFEQALGQAAGYVGQGSQRAADYLTRGYEDAFRMKNEAISGGMNERRRRLGAEVGAQGLSPEMLRRQLFVLDAEDRAQLGELFAESGMGLNTDLAELAKGTGTELAGMKQDELSLLLEMAFGAKARKAARKSKSGLGGILGTVAGSFLGPVGAAAGGALGGALFGDGGAYGGNTTSGGLGGF